MVNDCDGADEAALRRAVLCRPLLVGVALLSLSLAGCSSIPDVPSGTEAYDIVPAKIAAGSTQLDYQIGPLDVLTITVFREPDLSLEDVPVDASGNIIFPLIGQQVVAGKTSSQVSAMIADKLGKRFLINPQVSVIVKSSVSQKVTVEGQVTEPGVFELQGQTTLLQALAMAKGPTRIARLKEAIVFREMNGKRYAAMFDISKIRRGEADDPQILGNDTVVVGLSQGKAIFRDVLTVAPILTSAFIAIGQNRN